MDSTPIPGFYIAHHRWLDIEHGPGCLHKVGHTGSLGSRLNDSSYVTCFPPGWRYLATFELPTKEDAFLLETAVLHCSRHYRLGSRELVRLPVADLVALAIAAAAALGLKPVQRDAPEYAVVMRRPILGGGGKATPVPKREPPTAQPAEPSAWAAKRACVENLTVPDVGDELARALASLKISRPGPVAKSGPPADLSELVDDILLWDFSAIKPPPVPEPKPVAMLTPKPVPVPRTPPLGSASKTPARAPAKTPGPDEMEVEQAEQDWEMADAVQELAGSPYDLQARPIEARPYQVDATALCLKELRENGKAILQMACRCGKTPIAYGVLCEFLAEGAGAALFLVPGLPLLRQTAQKLASYGFADPILLVGSDPRPVPLAGGRELSMTTDPAAVQAFLAERGRRLVVSTYQSSPQIPADAFVLTVFDESHRVCGGAAPRAFNHALLAPRAGARLFMTATPAYDPPAKGVLTMKDRALFGGVAYRYHLRQGIGAGYVNDFQLEIVAAPAAAAARAASALQEGARDAQARDEALPDQLLAAMAKVDKLLVFCRDTAQATRLSEALAAIVAAGDALPVGVAPFETLLAHSKMRPGGAVASLRRLAEPGVRAALFSCRMFQEGVEVPALNGVFFAAPRHSPRDIIQCLCRPLNRAEGKPPSIVFLPVLVDPTRAPDDPANLKRYATIVPFVDALLGEDPRLYEHLLDPAGSPYPLDLLGAHTLGAVDARKRAALLGAVRRAVRYSAVGASRAERLLRVENVPWDRGFAEVRRIVETCGRYPKTTDAWVVGEARVCLHRFYRWAADEFAAWRAGRPTKLEPHQITDLQTLPKWEPFGVEGPYPWGLCMKFLEDWLAEHEGVPPLVEVNRGGYVGLEASMVERLSGALTCVNQADGKARKGKAPGSGYTLSPAKQADLRRICEPHGLRWRKERMPNGALIKDGPQTFIQEAHARFKEYYKTHGAEGEYIAKYFEGYPLKHSKQENMEVQEKGLAPPRWRAGRRKKADADADEA